jgi:hypothetical protein
LILTAYQRRHLSHRDRLSARQDLLLTKAVLCPLRLAFDRTVDAPQRGE